MPKKRLSMRKIRELLRLKYLTAHPNGYRYSRFCERYRVWWGRIDVVMRQVYRAGEKAFVDYAGPEVRGRGPGDRRGAGRHGLRRCPRRFQPHTGGFASRCGWRRPVGRGMADRGLGLTSFF